MLQPTLIFHIEYSNDERMSIIDHFYNFFNEHVFFLAVESVWFRGAKTYPDVDMSDVVSGEGG
jgi:hypothetical protein